MSRLMIPSDEPASGNGTAWCLPQRGSHRSPRPVLIFLAVAAVAVLTGCKKAAAPALPPPVVGVLTLAPTNVTLTAEFIGQLDSPQNVEVRARVEAFVKEVLFVEGQPVAQEAPLFQLDPEPLQQRLAAAEGLLAEARAALKKYEADVARLEPLAKQRAIPKQDLDNALASVEVGQANVQSAEARVASAKLDLSYCDVRAPVAGLIGAKQVSVGSLVGKGEPTLLATISTLNPIWFYCTISEVEYLRLERWREQTGRKLGELPPTLILSDGTELATPGKWVFLDRAVDATTGTLRARAEFANTNEVLRPGMFARGRVSLKLDQPGLVVPQRAVQELQGQNFVWVVDGENKASQRPIKLGPLLGSGVVVLEGLKAGEKIVFEGVHKVRQDAVVQPMTPEQIAAAAQAVSQAGAGHASAKATEAQPAKE